MSAGARRNLITIKHKTVTGKDSHGQAVFTLATTATVWAEIWPMSGTEMQKVDQRWAEARFRFRIQPYTEGIARDMTIFWGSRKLDIMDVEDPTGKRKMVEGYARELVA